MEVSDVNATEAQAASPWPDGCDSDKARDATGLGCGDADARLTRDAWLGSLADKLKAKASSANADPSICFRIDSSSYVVCWNYSQANSTLYMLQSKDRAQCQ